MPSRLPTLTLNGWLAALAFVLGLGAVFISPTHGGVVSVDPAELALIVQRELDHVTVDDLADWIIKSRADYRLVDLRDEQAYTEYHVPGAERVPLTRLADASFEPTERIVLYSDGGIHSAQAWFLLKANGYRGVYILRGGLDAWKDEVLFPALAGDATPYQARRNETLKTRAAFFGGRPRSGGAAPAAPALNLPTVDFPSAASASQGAPRRKKKEGC